jgi:hypothetical protein
MSLDHESRARSEPSVVRALPGADKTLLFLQRELATVIYHAFRQ